jgi:type IV secretion system protein VirB1
MDALPALMQQCAPAIHPATLVRVLSRESGQRVLAIGVNGARLERQPQNLSEAVATARNLQRLGYDFDAGLAQINVRNWSWLGLTPETVFNPCENLKAAQRVLLDCFDRAPSRDAQTRIRQMLSCYNTGNHRDGFRNGYVYGVVGVPVAIPTVPSIEDMP